MTDRIENINITSIVNSSNERFFINNQIVLIFTWIVHTVLCLLLDVFGFVTNIVNIICFIKQGFKDSITVSLLGLSVSDLGCLVTQTLAQILFNPAITTADIPFDPLDMQYLISGTPHLSFSRVSSWITAIITLERCLCVIAPLKIKTIATPKRATIIIMSVFILSFSSASPTYAVNRLEYVFSPRKNKTLLGLVSTKDRESVEKISFLINNFIIPLTAFIVIVTCTVTLAFKLHNTEKWRRQFSTISPQPDRLSGRHQSDARMVLIMSTLFIFCSFPICAGMLALAYEPGLYFSDKYRDLGIMLAGICFLLESVNSSVNIFIYYYMSSNYRDTFRKMIYKRSCF